MINRIISNLPFRPSLVDELSFYSRRLRKEQSIRRLGFIMIILSVVVQMSAAALPAKKSLAESGNDVIRGGVDNLQQLRNKYNSQADVRGLYQRFGLDKDDLRDGGAEHINFGFRYQGDQGTRTVGRINFNYTRDQSLGRFGGTEFFSRSASEWQGSTPAFAFGRQQGSDGRYYRVWVLKDCGNIAYLPEESFDMGLSSARSVSTPEPDQPAAAVTTTAPALGLRTTTASIPSAAAPLNLELQKSAINVTQGLDPKRTTEVAAKPGNTIEYTLLTKSKYAKPVENYVVEDYVGDLLDYSDLDMASITSQGGAYIPDSKKIAWGRQTIPSENGLRKTFKVKVKKNIPKTNSPNVTAPDFDCRMQNGYGNEVVIKIDCPLVKQVEALPNTGPGTTAVIGFGLITLSGYFLARNGLLATEVAILRRSYSNQGGKR